MKTQQPAVALLAADGAVSVQVLARELAVPLDGEGELLQARLNSIM